MSAAKTRDWRRPLPIPPRDYFKPGMAVRHLNPELADWRGFVDTVPSGKYRGRWARTDAFGGPSVYVRWTAGTRDDGEPQASTGWMNAEAVERMGGAR